VIRHSLPSTLVRYEKVARPGWLLLLRGLFLVTLVTLPCAAGAQAPTRAQLDSIEQRLEEAEAALAMLREQMATEAGMALKTRSRVSLEFSGRALMNAFTNSRRVNNVDVPLYARSDSGTGPQGGAAMSIRQTRLALAFGVSEVAGGDFTGDIDVDFFGGQFPSGGGRTFPVVRLRTARATLDWGGGALMIGQDQPLISTLDPISLAQVGVPGFTYAGNLWLWLPQIRGTVRTTGPIRFGAQAAILAPTSGDPNGTFETQFDAAERTGVPYLQGQLRMDWGEDDAAGELAVGYHMGKIDDAADVRRETNAMAVTARVPIGARLEIRAEAFDGQALKGLGGGGIGQGIGVGGVPIRTVGGWGQLNFKASPRLLIGAGAGMDDPEDADVNAGGRTKNTMTEAHVHWRPAGPLVFGVEWRQIETAWTGGTWKNQHFNLAFGFEF
jgi:hypothetical protein